MFEEVCLYFKSIDFSYGTKITKKTDPSGTFCLITLHNEEISQNNQAKRTRESAFRIIPIT